MGEIRDLTGLKFGRLIVIKEFGRDKHRNVTWLCRCVCGTYKVIVGYSLTFGTTKSCGCYQKECISERQKKDLTEQRFAFALGNNTLFSGKGFVRDLTCAYNLDDYMGVFIDDTVREFITVRRQHPSLTITIELTEETITQSTESLKFPIRNKYVEDCSIDELLFAIQSKIKNGEE